MHRSEIELTLQRADAAATDAARALTMMRSLVRPGNFSSFLGHAYLALGRAEDARGRHGDALAAFRSAAEQFEHTLGPDHVDTRGARQLANGV